MTTPDTVNELTVSVKQHGFHSQRTKMTREVLIKAIHPLFEHLREDASDEPKDFDWAVQPTSIAVLEFIKRMLGLDRDQQQQCFEVLRKFGNSSSPSVLVILDHLRAANKHGQRRDVVALSTGPCMTSEMVMLRPC